MPVKQQTKNQSPVSKPAIAIDEHIVEILSDSGEGAQKCGQSFGSIAARVGNGIWTVEIIPAEIQPPARSIEGASGNRIRIASRPVANGGDQADLMVAFNEQVLLGRLQGNELKPGGIILLEDKWRTDPDPKIAASYARVYDELALWPGFDVTDRNGRSMAVSVECFDLTLSPQAAEFVQRLTLHAQQLV